MKSKISKARATKKEIENLFNLFFSYSEISQFWV